MSARKRVTFDDIFEDSPPDEQATTYEIVAAKAVEGIDIIRRELGAFTSTEDEITLAAQARLRIIKDHAASIQASINVGLGLIDLKKRLNNNLAFSKFIESREILPFGSNYAFKVMRVAEYVETFKSLVGENVFQLDRLPPITVCYELTTLPPNELKTAAERGMLQAADTSRREVGKIKATLNIRAPEIADRKRALLIAIREVEVIEERLVAARAKVEQMRERLRLAEQAGI